MKQHTPPKKKTKPDPFYDKRRPAPPPKKLKKKRPKPAPAAKPVRVELYYEEMSGEKVQEIMTRLARGQVGGLPLCINPRGAAGHLEQAGVGIGAGLTLGYQINKLTGLHPENLRAAGWDEDFALVVATASLDAARNEWDRSMYGRTHAPKTPFQEHLWLGTAAPVYRNPFAEQDAAKKAPGKPQGAESIPTPPKPAPEKILAPRANRYEIPVEANGKRWKVFGVAVTHILRWCGFDAWSVADGVRLMAVLNISEVNLNTVKAQVSSGRKGDDGPHGTIPTLTPKQEQQLRDAIEDPPAPEPQKKMGKSKDLPPRPGDDKPVDPKNPKGPKWGELFGRKPVKKPVPIDFIHDGERKDREKGKKLKLKKKGKK